MKLAILLPGYLDSPDYLHMKLFSKELRNLGYEDVVLDPCGLWKSNNENEYSVTNYLKNIKTTIDSFKSEQLDEVVLIGHSLGGFVSIIAGGMYPEVTKIVSLCPPASIDALGTKWEGKPFRISRRDLPDDSTKLREFNIPLTFVEDAQKYSALNIIKDINKPLMIFIGLADTSVSPAETETLVTNAKNPHVVRMQNIGHNFRNSENECNLVMEEIKKFLSI